MGEQAQALIEDAMVDAEIRKEACLFQSNENNNSDKT